MQRKCLETIIRRGAYYLAEDLLSYWPSCGENEIPESNITIHLGRAFSEEGFCVFTDVHTKNSTEKRLDFLALNAKNGTQVILEAKRLYSSEKLSKMSDDIHRIAEFQLIDNSWTARIKHRWGIIAATTWKSDYARWWSSDGAPHPSSHKVWSIMENNKILKEASWGSFVLRGLDQNEKPDTAFHYFLWCAFMLK